MGKEKFAKYFTVTLLILIGTKDTYLLGFGMLMPSSCLLVTGSFYFSFGVLILLIIIN